MVYCMSICRFSNEAEAEERMKDKSKRARWKYGKRQKKGKNRFTFCTAAVETQIHLIPLRTRAEDCGLQSKE